MKINTHPVSQVVKLDDILRVIYVIVDIYEDVFFAFPDLMDYLPKFIKCDRPQCAIALTKLIVTIKDGHDTARVQESRQARRLSFDN